jgi:hypothetical protein
MARRGTRTLVACAAVALAAARASGVAPVEYRVEAKAFKATRADSNLVFSAFSDADCSTLVDETTLLANDERIAFERLSAVVAKGGGKPPKRIMIRTNLATAATGSFYLTVSGDGITPAGDACQLQAGGAPGETGPQGPPGDPGAPATALWAVVNADASLARGSGAVSTASLAFGTYEVLFDRNVSACAYMGSAGPASGGVPPDAFVTVAPRNGNVNGVFVDVRTSAGASVANPFHLAVFCP